MHSNTSRRTFLVPRAIHFSPYIRRTLLPLPRPNISLFSSFYTQHNTHRSQHSTFRIFNHTQARARAHTHMHTHTHTQRCIITLAHTHTCSTCWFDRFKIQPCKLFKQQLFIVESLFFFLFFFFKKSTQRDRKIIHYLTWKALKS